MVLRLVAGTLIVLGATMACGIAATAGKHELGATIGALLFSAVGPAGAGVWLWRLSRRRERARLESGDRADGVRLLGLARTRGGSLTAAEVLSLTGIELSRAEQLLDGLCRQGLAEHRIADDGTMVYRIKPLLGAQEKERARGVLERD